MTSEYVGLLALSGDPIEKEGVIQYRLGEVFPRYARFWASYVFPNRDSNDSTKLRSEFPIEIEDICNNHYSVFYQLTIACRQIKALSNPLLDVGDPFYHLGTTADLIERTFVAVYRVKCNLTDVPFYSILSKDKYMKRTEEFWAEDFSEQLEQFERNYRPISISFLRLSDILNYHFPDTEIRSDFHTIANQIRQYRNILIHSLPPLKIIDNDVTYIPKREHLHRYKDARWSSNRTSVNRDHYASTVEILEELAGKLIASANSMWENLLEVMHDIATHPKYSNLLGSAENLFESSESGAIPMSRLDPPDHYNPGSETYRLPTELIPPTIPSGYKIDPHNTPGTGVLKVDNEPD